MSEYIPYRLGALITQKKRHVSTGRNSRKTHARTVRDYNYWGPTHAEASAILKAKGEGDTLYVVRIKKDGSLAMSKPCFRCLKMAKDNGIKTIIYTDADGQPQTMELS